MNLLTHLTVFFTKNIEAEGPFEAIGQAFMQPWNSRKIVEIEKNTYSWRLLETWERALHGTILLSQGVCLFESLTLQSYAWTYIPYCFCLGSFVKSICLLTNPKAQKKHNDFILLKQFEDCELCPLTKKKTANKKIFDITNEILNSYAQLDALPSELKITILEFVDQKDLRMLICVSKTWSNFFSHNFLYQRQMIKNLFPNVISEILMLHFFHIIQKNLLKWIQKNINKK